MALKKQPAVAIDRNLYGVTIVQKLRAALILLENCPS